jgi:hypothetical protein
MPPFAQHEAKEASRNARELSKSPDHAQTHMPANETWREGQDLADRELELGYCSLALCCFCC